MIERQIIKKNLKWYRRKTYLILYLGFCMLHVIAGLNANENNILMIFILSLNFIILFIFLIHAIIQLVGRYPRIIIENGIITFKEIFGIVKFDLSQVKIVNTNINIIFKNERKTITAFKSDFPKEKIEEIMGINLLLRSKNRIIEKNIAGLQ